MPQKTLSSDFIVKLTHQLNEGGSFSDLDYNNPSLLLTRAKSWASKVKYRSTKCNNVAMTKFSGLLEAGKCGGRHYKKRQASYFISSSHLTTITKEY